MEEDAVVAQPCCKGRRHEEDGEAVSHAMRLGQGLDAGDDIFGALSVSADGSL